MGKGKINFPDGAEDKHPHGGGTVTAYQIFLKSGTVATVEVADGIIISATANLLPAVGRVYPTGRRPKAAVTAQP
jgi:hypothetical protein